MELGRLLLAIGVMALVTYLPRVIPITVFRKKINNVYFKSFLNYMPYGVLAAMVFPEVLYSTASLYSAIFGTLVALFLSYKKQGLMVVAIGGTAAVWICEQLLTMAGVM